MKQVRQKLRSQRGESLGEVLVALLVAALAITILAGAIVTAGRIITQSREAMGEYYASNNELSAHSGTPTGGKVTFSEKLVDGTNEATVNFYVNRKYDEVVSYHKG